MSEYHRPSYLEGGDNDPDHTLRPGELQPITDATPAPNQLGGFIQAPPSSQPQPQAQQPDQPGAVLPPTPDAEPEIMSRYDRIKQRQRLTMIFVFCFLIIGLVTWYLLWRFVPSLPQVALVSTASISVVVAVILSGLILDGAYAIITPNRYQSEHKATRVAVLGNALLVLVAVILIAALPQWWLLWALFGTTVIILPIILVKIRGSLAECEYMAREALRNSAIPTESRFYLHYSDLPVHGGEIRSHPNSLVKWFAPCVIGVGVALAVSPHTSWWVLVGALVITLFIVVWRLVLIQNEVYMFTDTGVTQHKGVLESEPDTVGFGDMKKKRYKIGYFQLWCAGNRYTKTKVGSIYFDTAAQDETFNVIREIRSVTAFYWLMFGRNKGKTAKAAKPAA